jgi:hypothetical protein
MTSLSNGTEGDSTRTLIAFDGLEDTGDRASLSLDEWSVEVTNRSVVADCR